MGSDIYIYIIYKYIVSLKYVTHDNTLKDYYYYYCKVVYNNTHKFLPIVLIQQPPKEKFHESDAHQSPSLKFGSHLLLVNFCDIKSVLANSIMVLIELICSLICQWALLLLGIFSSSMFLLLFNL